MSEKALNNLLGPLVEDLGYEFIGLEYHPHPRNAVVRVYIDSDDGIAIEDCERVSRDVHHRHFNVVNFSPFTYGSPIPPNSCVLMKLNLRSVLPFGNGDGALFLTLEINLCLNRVGAILDRC